MAKNYASKFNKKAKLIVVSMTANKASISDPNDERMLDIVGFDANIPVMIEEFISN